MLKYVVFAGCLVMPAAAQAYSQCTAKVLAGAGASVAEEGHNPVQSGAYIYAGFVEGHDVGVAASGDNGKTLGDPVTIYSGPTRVGGLRLAAAGDAVFALWGRDVDANTTELYLGRSMRHGKAGSWHVKDLGPYQTATLAQFSVDGTNVHAAFASRDGTIQIRNSSDSGRTFGETVTIGAGAAEVVVTSMGADVYVAWNTGKPRSDSIFAASHDSGKSFTVTNLAADGPQSHEPIFSLSPDGNRLSLVWRDSPSQGAYVQSLDHGATWSASIHIDSPTAQYMVADDGTYIWISYLKLFQINGKNDLQVFLTRSIDGGKSFPPAKDISGPTGISMTLNDDQRPIPWVGGNLFRLTAVEADGVHAWSGNTGHLLGSAYLGPGGRAAPANNSMVWNGPDGSVMYGICK